MLIYLHFVSLLTSPWAEGGCEKVCRLTGSEDISTSQPSGILISRGKVHFTKTEELFLLLEMQPERVFRQLGCCPLPKLMCVLASSFASKRLLFCMATCQTRIESGEAGRSIWVFVRLLTPFFFFPYSASHLKDCIFTEAGRHLSEIEFSIWDGGGC